jgi:hypothetical protein
VQPIRPHGERTGASSGSQSAFIPEPQSQSATAVAQMWAALDPRDDSHRQPNTADQAA